MFGGQLHQHLFVRVGPRIQATNQADVGLPVDQHVIVMVDVVGPGANGPRSLLRSLVESGQFDKEMTECLTPYFYLGDTRILGLRLGA